MRHRKIINLFNFWLLNLENNKKSFVELTVSYSFIAVKIYDKVFNQVNLPQLSYTHSRHAT